MLTNTISTSCLAAEIQNTVGVDRVTVLVGGCARAGKSTVSEEIFTHLNRSGVDSVVIPMDLWIRPASERPTYTTVTERYRIAEFESAMNDLCKGHAATLLPYNYRTRELDALPIIIGPVSKQAVLIVEGVLALFVMNLRERANFKVFVEVNDFTRLKRLTKFYKYEKGVHRQHYKRLILSREKEEVALVKSTATFADYRICPTRTPNKELHETSIDIW
jgi:uridine kinase